MKKIKIFMALMLTIISLVVIAPVQANAAYSYYENYTFSTGALWWKEDFYAFVYRDPNWFTVFYGSPSHLQDMNIKIIHRSSLIKLPPFQLEPKLKEH
jgi:hypothetical protein